jgi:hypothetical protein
MGRFFVVIDTIDPAIVNIVYTIVNMKTRYADSRKPHHNGVCVESSTLVA